MSRPRTVLSVKEHRPKRIAHISFGLLSGPDMVRLSHLNIHKNNMYVMNSFNPAAFGCLDPRLGVSDKHSVCETCKKKLQECTGHFGYVKMELPVFHIGYFKALQNVLQNICKACARILVHGDERHAFLRHLRNPKADSLMRMELRKRVTEKCKRVHTCPHCGAKNGTIKKITNAGFNSLRLIHERFKKQAERDAAFLVLEHDLASAIDGDKDLVAHVRKAQDDLTPLKVLELLRRIPSEDLALLWSDGKMSHPARMILTHLLCPPVAIRPSVKMEGGSGSTEDDLTLKLQEIVHINNALKQKLSNGAPMKLVTEDWDFLQVQVRGRLHYMFTATTLAMHHSPLIAFLLNVLIPLAISPAARLRNTLTANSRVFQPPCGRKNLSVGLCSD